MPRDPRKTEIEQRCTGAARDEPRDARRAGRPRLSLTDAERAERKRAQARARQARRRDRNATGARLVVIPPDVADEFDAEKISEAIAEILRAALFRDLA